MILHQLKSLSTAVTMAAVAVSCGDSSKLLPLFDVPPECQVDQTSVVILNPAIVVDHGDEQRTTHYFGKEPWLADSQVALWQDLSGNWQSTPFETQSVACQRARIAKSSKIWIREREVIGDRVNWSYTQPVHGFLDRRMYRYGQHDARIRTYDDSAQDSPFVPAFLLRNGSRYIAVSCPSYSADWNDLYFPSGLRVQMEIFERVGHVDIINPLLVGADGTLGSLGLCNLLLSKELRYKIGDWIESQFTFHAIMRDIRLAQEPLVELDATQAEPLPIDSIRIEFALEHVRKVLRPNTAQQGFMRTSLQFFESRHLSTQMWQDLAFLGEQLIAQGKSQMNQTILKFPVVMIDPNNDLTYTMLYWNEFVWGNGSAFMASLTAKSRVDQHDTLQPPVYWPGQRRKLRHRQCSIRISMAFQVSSTMLLMAIPPSWPSRLPIAITTS